MNYAAFLESKAQKPSYYRQALKNLRAIGDAKMEQGKLFGNDEEEWIEE